MTGSKVALYVGPHIDFCLLWDAPINHATRELSFASGVRGCRKSVGEARVEPNQYSKEVQLFTKHNKNTWRENLMGCALNESISRGAQSSRT